MKFPKLIKHRNKVFATIYGKSLNYPRYRLAYYVAGRRRQRTFATYSEAKAESDKLVRDLASGSQVTALTASQARDALAALERLRAFFQATGRQFSLLGAVSELVEACGKLNGHSLNEAVSGFMRTVVNVQRKDLRQSVEEFIAAEELRTKSSEGQRAQVSPKYHYNRAIMLRRFAGTFPNTALCDLAKEHVDTFMTSLGEVKSKSRNRRTATSAKSRNHHRAAIRQLLQWAVRKDYLAPTHRLGEADQLRPEHANTAEISFYTPKELTAILAAAKNNLRAMIAIGGLAGLRTAELLRLDWADVWRVPGHIEVTARKSKTRARRLVEICPALAAWLAPFKPSTAGKLWDLHEVTFQEKFGAVCQRAGVARKANGLRHAFCTYHFALHGNENLTAAQAGNSPTMIHAHYKGLATKTEGQKWFAAKPAKSARNVIPMPAALPTN